MRDEYDYKNPAPYVTQQTPRGSVVICRGHLVTDELKPEEARALAASLNARHRSTQ